MIARILAWLEASPTLREYDAWACGFVLVAVFWWSYALMYGAAVVVSP